MQESISALQIERKLKRGLEKRSISIPQLSEYRSGFLFQVFLSLLNMDFYKPSKGKDYGNVENWVVSPFSMDAGEAHQDVHPWYLSSGKIDSRQQKSAGCYSFGRRSTSKSRFAFSLKGLRKSKGIHKG
mmetsp:Transcript_9668/g.12638  ORF Transcript_9668/g.12638 Transcript_9668/m.12638 type:complete len:129 (+) Transcript_9668:129-515(+)